MKNASLIKILFQRILMKQFLRQKILLILILFSFSDFALHKAMLIRPGESVGPFYINKTHLKEIRSQLGKDRIINLKWHAPHCGMTYPYEKLVYKDQGISFNLKTETPKDQFESIELSKPCDAITDKGISVYSTKEDVYKSYGQPDSIDNNRWLCNPPLIRTGVNKTN
jgi:hypothetical protein